MADARQAILALLIASALGAGCAAQAKRQEAALSELVQWLPGRYDNREQAQRDAAGGGAAQEALALAIVPIYAPALGRYAFYTQETAADDARRVTAQHIIAFDLAGGQIVQATFTLAEPVRWRDAHTNPDLFKGLIPHQDVRPLAGCELVWKREGERFTAANDPATCLIVSRATGTTVNLELRAELARGELALADRSYAADGSLAHGHPTAPFYRFVKRAH